MALKGQQTNGLNLVKKMVHFLKDRKQYTTIQGIKSNQSLIFTVQSSSVLCTILQMIQIFFSLITPLKSSVSVLTGT